MKLGFIGLGTWGTQLALAAERSGSAVASFGCARSAESRSLFAETFGCPTTPDLATLLDGDVEAVVVATPTSTHAELTIAAAQAGKHILVEKPFTLDVSSARAAIQEAERAGVVLQVGHQRRKLAATRRLAELVQQGELGVLHMLEATTFIADGLRPHVGWKFDLAQRPLGAMTQRGVHMIDNMHYLAGPAARVMAATSQLLKHGRGEDVTGFLIEYASGPIGLLANSAIGANITTLAAHGTAGSAWSDQDGSRLWRLDMGAVERREIELTPVDAVAAQFDEFAQCIRTGRQPEVDGWGALEVVAVLQAGILSAARGTAVEVAEVRSSQPMA